MANMTIQTRGGHFPESEKKDILNTVEIATEFYNLLQKQDLFAGLEFLKPCFRRQHNRDGLYYEFVCTVKFCYHLRGEKCEIWFFVFWNSVSGEFSAKRKMEDLNPIFSIVKAIDEPAEAVKWLPSILLNSLHAAIASEKQIFETQVETLKHFISE